MAEERKIESFSDLNDMDLHESVFIEPGGHMYRVVTKVPGGWIYTFHGEKMITSCFVPEEAS